MRKLRYACAAAVTGALLLLPAAALAAQPAATPLDGRPPLAPDRSRDPLPDPEIKPLSLGKVELGARPDVTIREIRFVGWTEEDEIASGKVLAPAGVTVRPGRSVVVGWTAAVNATTLKISRRIQGTDEWTLVAADVDPSAMAYVDNGKLRGGMVYEYRVEATGLGGLMSVAADPVLVAVPKRGTSIIVR